MEMEIFWHDLTVIFDQINASLLNKSMNFLFKKKKKNGPQTFKQ